VRLTRVFASFVLFILLSVTVYAQTLVNKSWVKTTGLPDAINWTGSCFDTEKNLIFVGNTVTAPGNANILVTKYNADGRIAWQRITGGAAGLNDYGVAVTVDNQNNSYIAAAMTASNGLFDFAVLKYDAQGTLQWTATWDGNHHLHDLPTAITLDDAGNVIVVGSSISFTQQSNYAVVKYNPAGIQLWATTYDHVGLHDFPTAIEKASNDNIVVTGASSSAPNSWDYATILVNGATGPIENVNRVNVPEIGLDQPLAVARDAQNNLFITGYNEKQGNKNIQTVKLNSNFGLEWVQSYDAGGLEDIAKSIGCDALGNVYVAGHSKTTQEGTTFIVLKYDTQGNLLWNQTYKPYTHDGAQAADIRVMPTGDFYLSGTIQKGSESDFATLKYNKDGQIEWEKRFDGSGTDEVTTIKADNNGNVYVSGISEDISGKKYSTIKYSSQKNIQTIIYRADGSPSHIADELILKLSHAAVNHEFVNDGDRVYGTAEEILSNNAITQMESVLPFNIKNNPEVQFSKIFTSMKTSDTISISRLGSRIPIPAFWSTLLMKIPEGFDMQTIENQLNTLFPLVEYNHFNFLGIPESFPNDSLITGRNVRQTSLRPEGLDTTAHINVDSAWNVTTGKNYIKVGVYDYPVYWKHPDFGGTTFQNSVVKGGFDYVNSVHISLASTPVNSHGTNCAGIIGAMRNNQIGIAGIAGGNHVLRDTGVSLYSFGIFKNDSTAATTQTIANAIYEGASSTYYGLQLQNHSWSMPSAPEALRKSIKFAYANNCILVASRGNNGVFEPRYPACFKDEWVLNIGAAGNDGHFKTQQNGFIDNDWQSSYGHNVDIIAPGSADNIYTTNGPTHSNRCGSSPDEYACFRGTSAAAPHVSGSIALMLSLHNTRRGYPNNI
jgi:Subtilase family